MGPPLAKKFVQRWQQKVTKFKIKIKHHFVIWKSAAIPTFYERNFSFMLHFWNMNFLFFFLDNRGLSFCLKRLFQKNFIQKKACIGHRCHIRQFWDQKSKLIIINFFFQKLVWFILFYVHIPKIDIWGIWVLGIANIFQVSTWVWFFQKSFENISLIYLVF